MKIASLFFLYLFLELFAVIAVGNALGSVNTFLLFIATALLGVAVLMAFKSILNQSIRRLLQGDMRIEELIASNALAIVGAMLLILPGFITDAVGIAMLLGFVYTTLFGFHGTVRRRRAYTSQTHYQNQGENDVIDVEIVEFTHTLK
ncbi:MAG: hypothetical protein KU28_00085 [Sulfurovum sp. PC08-66]|nr:MAG: hypothetical protein KU28_00085 [Sulfurovum sp. PC08-66]KIM12373.1 MAG: hypothetical protein KU37_00205 [Sulfuricurvum sp. PC08-66]